MSDARILDELIHHPPRLFPLGDGRRVAYSISVSLLHFLDDHLKPNMCTLETGAGISTILFALRGARHTAIAPSAELAENIRAYCRERGIADGQTTFIADRSEDVLPALESTPLDLVLIDGRHAFPSPMIDWYYTADRLNIGGLVIVDDIPLWPPRVLHDFLMGEPEWEHVATLERRSSIFRKLREGSNDKGFRAQPYTLAKSKNRRATFLGALELVLKGRFDLLGSILHRRKQRRNQIGRP